jgi:steroid delta-isomerase-like uncharacterized protein
MAEKENETLSRRVFEEVWGKGDLSKCDELFSSDFVDHDAANPEVPPGPEGVKRIVTMYRTAFPDIVFTIDEQISSGDRVATRWTARGTHKGELAGYKPTGKAATISGLTIERFVGDKIAEAYTSWDSLSLMRQLGLAPEAEARV